MAEYWQRGESLDFTNTGTEKISHGQVVVIGSKIGIAGCDIGVGETGSVQVEGVFMFEVSGFSAGDHVKYDDTSKNIVAATDSSDAHGWAVYDSTSDGKTYVKLIG